MPVEGPILDPRIKEIWLKGVGKWTPWKSKVAPWKSKVAPWRVQFWPLQGSERQPCCSLHQGWCKIGACILLSWVPGLRNAAVHEHVLKPCAAHIGFLCKNCSAKFKFEMFWSWKPCQLIFLSVYVIWYALLFVIFVVWGWHFPLQSNQHHPNIRIVMQIYSVNAIYSKKYQFN